EGAISFFTGEVTLNGGNASIGDKVVIGDRIETGSDSFCEVLFGEKNIFRLQDNSSLKFGGSVFNLDKGSIALVTSRLKKIAFNTDSLSVRTSSAVAGVRGTVFFIKKEDDNNTYVCICNGKINTYDRSGNDKKSEEAGHHKAMRLTLSGSIVTRANAPLLYHDDALMEEVASKIGVTIKWSSEEPY
ncbi:MAG: FecR family protein, partial [Spirochaetia bacterium]|nr:FecR family protein [Spirochaetia bacterium]